MGLIREWRNSNPEGREWRSIIWCTAFEMGALVIPHCLASFLSVYHNCVFACGGKSGFSSSRSVTNTCKDPQKTFCARVLGVGGLCAGWRNVSVIPPSGATLSLGHPHSLLSCRLNFCFKVGLISCVLGFWGFGLFVFVLFSWNERFCLICVSNFCLRRGITYVEGAFQYKSHEPGKNSRLHLKSLLVLFLKCLLILFVLIAEGKS